MEDPGGPSGVGGMQHMRSMDGKYGEGLDDSIDIEEKIRIKFGYVRIVFYVVDRVLYS
jgi:hypothetical protein